MEKEQKEQTGNNFNPSHILKRLGLRGGFRQTDEQMGGSHERLRMIELLHRTDNLSDDDFKKLGIAKDWFLEECR